MNTQTFLLCILSILTNRMFICIVKKIQLSVQDFRNRLESILNYSTKKSSFFIQIDHLHINDLILEIYFSYGSYFPCGRQNGRVTGSTKYLNIIFLIICKYLKLL